MPGRLPHPSRGKKVHILMIDCKPIGGGRCLVVLPPCLKNALVTACLLHAASKGGATKRKPRCLTSAVILPCPEGQFFGGNLIRILGPYFEGGSCQTPWGMIPRNLTTEHVTSHRIFQGCVCLLTSKPKMTLQGQLTMCKLGAL